MASGNDRALRPDESGLAAHPWEGLICVAFGQEEGLFGKAFA